MKRELGMVTLSDERPERTPEEQRLADQALEVLREEVARLAAMDREHDAERKLGAPSAGPRDGATRLEGACRFALRMGLVTPAEARQVFHEAAELGLRQRGGDK